MVSWKIPYKCKWRFLARNFYGLFSSTPCLITPESSPQVTVSPRDLTVIAQRLTSHPPSSWRRACLKPVPCQVQPLHDPRGTQQLSQGSSLISEASLAMAARLLKDDGGETLNSMAMTQDPIQWRYVRTICLAIFCGDIRPKTQAFDKSSLEPISGILSWSCHVVPTHHGSYGGHVPMGQLAPVSNMAHVPVVGSFPSKLNLHS